MTSDLYPFVDSNDQLSAFAQEVARLREQDVEDFANLPNVFMRGRKVDKIPTSASDTTGDREGDFNYDANFFYICVNNSGTLQWKTLAFGSAFGVTSSDFFIDQAIAEIQATFGDTVSVTAKNKTLIKFGRNDSVGTSDAVIMQFEGSETEIPLSTTNDIDRVVTTDNTFTGEVTIEGHTISGNDLTFVSQTATLNGQTGVTLSTPLARATRIFISDGSELAAADRIFVYENVATTSGVPNTTANIHIQMDGNYGQSQKCQTAISKDDYWLITLVYGSILRKTSATANLRLQVKAVGTATWRTVFERAVSTNGSDGFEVDYPPVYIVPKNYDVRMVASASTSGVEIIAGIGGYLAAVQT